MRRGRQDIDGVAFYAVGNTRLMFAQSRLAQYRPSGLLQEDFALASQSRCFEQAATRVGKRPANAIWRSAATVFRSPDSCPMCRVLPHECIHQGAASRCALGHGAASLSSVTSTVSILLHI